MVFDLVYKLYFILKEQQIVYKQGTNSPEPYSIFQMILEKDKDGYF